MDRFFVLDAIEPDRLASFYKSISTKEERLGLLKLLVDAATGEADRIAAERNELLKRVSIELEIPAQEYNRLRTDRVAIDTEAYGIIGITPEASDQEIHRVYRRLASQFHPDTGGDLDDTQREQSSEAFLKIQDAYDRIIADRNALRTDDGDDSV
jgi:DnaJ-domain-containing protein 1